MLCAVNPVTRGGSRSTLRARQLFSGNVLSRTVRCDREAEASEIQSSFLTRDRIPIFFNCPSVGLRLVGIRLSARTVKWIRKKSQGIWDANRR